MNMHKASRPTDPAKLSSMLCALRENILDHWCLRVAAEIPAAADLDEPVLVNMIPKLYDNIVRTLSTEVIAEPSIDASNLASAHGRERATTTNYSAHDVIHEIQIFREVLFSITKAKGINLSNHHAQAVGRLIEETARESISGFSEVDRQKNINFIASLSHDLRNPLNVANASAQLIQLKTTDPSILNLARRICQKIVETDAMIQTLLDASRRHGKMKVKLHLTSFDMMTLIKEVCADFALFGPAVRILGEPVVGQWCRVSMKRVLENLISNAQKYGDTSQPITVQASRENDLLLLSVHNEGQPIPHVEMDRLFQPYQRIEETSVRGWGLGLPYVQSVAESHGGTVVIDSSLENGTKFTVTIPIDARMHLRQ